MSTVTVTAKSGPGFTATALVITDVTSFTFDLEHGVLSVFVGSIVQVYALSTVTTVTVSISGSTYTVTVS